MRKSRRKEGHFVETQLKQSMDVSGKRLKNWKCKAEGRVQKVQGGGVRRRAVQNGKRRGGFCEASLSSERFTASL